MGHQKSRPWVQTAMSPKKHRILKRIAKKTGMKMQPTADLAVDCLAEKVNGTPSPN